MKRTPPIDTAAAAQALQAMMREQVEVKDDRQQLIFIHSKLDDLGLTHIQFRLYAHLARRAGRADAWCSLSSMAKACGLKRRAICYAVKSLLDAKLVKKHKRPGWTTVYTLTDPSVWQKPKKPSFFRKLLTINAGTSAPGCTSAPGDTGVVHPGARVKNVTTLPKGLKHKELVCPKIGIREEQGNPLKVIPVQEKKGKASPASLRNKDLAARAHASRLQWAALKRVLAEKKAEFEDEPTGELRREIAQLSAEFEALSLRQARGEF